MSVAPTRTPVPAAVEGPTTTAPGTGLTLRDVIDRWHAAHPDFVAVLPCVEPAAFDLVSQQTQAAKRIGVSLTEYQERTAAQQGYCTAHKDWHHRTAFAFWEGGRECKSHRNERERSYPSRQKRRSS